MNKLPQKNIFSAQLFINYTVVYKNNTAVYKNYSAVFIISTADLRNQRTVYAFTVQPKDIEQELYTVLISTLKFLLICQLRGDGAKLQSGILRNKKRTGKKRNMLERYL